MGKEKDQQPKTTSNSAANTPKEVPTTAETANPAYQLANGSDIASQQKDMHNLANGIDEPSQNALSGNSEGASALLETATKLDNLMSHENTALLELDEKVKERYSTLSAVLRQYAAGNKAFLSSDLGDFPPNTFRGPDVAGVYDVNNDIIYLQKGPDSPDAFNTIIHEISHAENKESDDIKRLQEFDKKWGDQSNDSPEYLSEKSDMLLSVVVFELNAEIDGEVLENIEKNKDEPERSSGFKRNIRDWLTRTNKEGSSAAAFEKWKENIRTMAELTDKDPTFIFDGYIYKKAGEKYIVEGGEFPSLAKLTPTP